MKNIYCLVGASGTGKTTLLNYVKDNFNIEVSEVSARPFLPPTISYVESSNDKNQVLISQNRFLTIIEAHIKNKTILFSRSVIDSLAYGRVLGCGSFIDDLLCREIKISKDIIQYLYIPIQFGMNDDEDIVRGKDEDIQRKTDKAMLEIMSEYGIIPTIIEGNKKERTNKLNQIFKKFKKENV